MALFMNRKKCHKILTAFLSQHNNAVFVAARLWMSSKNFPHFSRQQEYPRISMPHS